MLAGHPAATVRRREQGWDEGPRTNYEAKYLVEGRPILRLEVTWAGGEGPAALHPAGRTGVVAAYRTEAAAADRRLMRQLRALLPYFRPYPRNIAVGMGSILAGAVVGLASPVLVGHAVDSFRTKPSARSLLVYAGLLLLVAACRRLHLPAAHGAGDGVAPHRGRPAQRPLRPPRAAAPGYFQRRRPAT